MLIGLLLATVQEAQQYQSLFDVFLITLNGSVFVYTMYAIGRPIIHEMLEQNEERRNAKVDATHHYNATQVVNAFSSERKTMVVPTSLLDVDEWDTAENKAKKFWNN